MPLGHFDGYHSVRATIYIKFVSHALKSVFDNLASRSTQSSYVLRAPGFSQCCGVPLVENQTSKGKRRGKRGWGRGLVLLFVLHQDGSESRIEAFSDNDMRVVYDIV